MLGGGVVFFLTGVFNCLIHLKHHESGRARETDRGMVSPRSLLESQATIWEDTVMFFAGVISHLFFRGKMFLCTKLIFRDPLTTDKQAHIWSQKKFVGLQIKKALGIAPLPSAWKPDGADELMLVNADCPKHSPVIIQAHMDGPSSTHLPSLPLLLSSLLNTSDSQIPLTNICLPSSM